MSRPDLSPWLATIPVGEPDEEGERPVVPVALARMTPEGRESFFEQLDAPSPEQLRGARILAEARAERDQAIAERDALREAAAALVADLESKYGDWPRFCGAPFCERVALHDDGDTVACDEHQEDLIRDDGLRNLSYAAPLRALRKLLEQKP